MYHRFKNNGNIDMYPNSRKPLPFVFHPMQYDDISQISNMV